MKTILKKPQQNFSVEESEKNSLLSKTNVSKFIQIGTIDTNI